MLIAPAVAAMQEESNADKIAKLIKDDKVMAQKVIWFVVVNNYVNSYADDHGQPNEVIITNLPHEEKIFNNKCRFIRISEPNGQFKLHMIYPSGKGIEIKSEGTVKRILQKSSVKITKETEASDLAEFCEKSVNPYYVPGPKVEPEIKKLKDCWEVGYITERNNYRYGNVWTLITDKDGTLKDMSKRMINEPVKTEEPEEDEKDKKERREKEKEEK